MTQADAKSSRQGGRLRDIDPALERILTVGGELPNLFGASEIKRQTIMVPMRDGVRMATDLYLPPRLPAPVIASRTPYERAHPARLDALMGLARAGYVVVSQDVRGTGDSEPDHWDWRIYEKEDSYDSVEWIQAQDWCDGFIGSCGGSYIGLTQWDMAAHPSMSAIAPEVSGFAFSLAPTVRRHMLMNSYSRSVGKGEGKVAGVTYGEMEQQMQAETLRGGYYNDPLEQPLSEALLERFPDLRPLSSVERRKWLWDRYNSLPPLERAELIKLAYSINIITIADHEPLDAIFGPTVPRGRPSKLDPQAEKMARALKAPPLVITGWYDWATENSLDSFALVQRYSDPDVASRARLLIAPDAHNVPGYHEGEESHPELRRTFRTQTTADLLLQWYGAVRAGKVEDWPKVTYYLLGANEWRTASAWPPSNAKLQSYYLGADGALTTDAPKAATPPDSYVYDPTHPAPTLGGSVVSFVYRPGSVDVSEAQARPDVLTYTTPPLEQDLDLAGNLKMILHASSSAIDTDFHVRLSDVFPDGRAIQLQTGSLRTRYRTPGAEPELIEPGRIYRLEVDMCATANRFKAGHRLRIDITSADFPRFDRNTNRGGEPGDPIPAEQKIYHDPEHPSCFIAPILS